jgi:hypothetical protein
MKEVDIPAVRKKEIQSKLQLHSIHTLHIRETDLNPARPPAIRGKLCDITII